MSVQHFWPQHCSIRSVVVHYPVYGCSAFSYSPHDVPYTNSRGNLVVTLSSIPKNANGSLPATLCYNRDIAGGFVPQYVGCAKVVNVQGNKVELKGHSTLLGAIKANGIRKGCMCAPAPYPAYAPPSGVVQSSYGPYPQGSPSASFSASITSSQIAQKHPSSGTWHYFDEYYCADVKSINFPCKPSLRKSVSKLNTVAIHETYLPIGGGDVCTLDPGNTFHFAIKINQREVNYTEFTNCCVGLHRCCAFSYCGQDGLGINVLPYPYWSENNCDNCHSAVMTYFSSMASQIQGYTMPNVCWASTVHCNDLKNSLISFGCSLGVGYQTSAYSSSTKITCSSSGCCGPLCAAIGNDVFIHDHIRAINSPNHQVVIPIYGDPLDFPVGCAIRLYEFDGSTATCAKGGTRAPLWRETPGPFGTFKVVGHNYHGVGTTGNELILEDTSNQAPSASWLAGYGAPNISACACLVKSSTNLNKMDMRESGTCKEVAV